MQAIILAAGMGRRLGEWTRDNTKCMLPVNGVRLIDRMLEQLSHLDLKRVIIVVGYQGQNVIDYIGSRYDGRLTIEFHNNPIYDKTNNIYSLSLVKDKMVEDDTLLIESDLIVDDRMFDLIVDDPFPNLALVAKYETWMDGTMVCIDQDCNIVNFVPKQAFRYEDTPHYYKTVNIYKFSRQFAERQYVPFLDAYVKALGNNEYYEQVLRVITLVNNAELKAKPVGSLPWYEIDDVQDKDIAETIFSSEEERLGKYMRRYGGYWRFGHLRDFCYLVNPYFPTERMKNELRANFDKLLTEYPSGMAVNSLLAGKCFNIRQEFVVAGNGAAELIKALMEGGTGRTGVVYPTFEEYPHRCNEDDIVRFCPEGDDLRYTVDDLMAHFADKGIQTLLLINPDNPSGNFIPVQDVLRLDEWCRARGIRLVVDESFVDFCRDWQTSSLLLGDTLLAHPTMVVVKSISKSFGVPGLRLGIMASADEQLIAAMKRDVAIWNINSFAEFWMQIYNKYEKDYRVACGKFQTARARFLSQLQSVPFLRVIPSEANYFLCEVRAPFTSRSLTEALLQQYNILIKDCDTKNGLQGRNMVRIAVRCPDDNEALVEALTELHRNHSHCRVCICGGGHLGHVTAGFLASQPNVEVAVLTRRPAEWSDCIHITDPDGKVFEGHLSLVTDSPPEALDCADMVLLCLPGFAIADELRSIRPHLRPDTLVGSIVGSTGFFFQAHDILPQMQPLFALQRVPFISRLTEYGHSANLLGYKAQLAVAIEHCADNEGARALIERLFQKPVKLLGSHYEASLTNSNPLLHTSRLFSLWRDFEPASTVSRVPQFYSEWTDEASELLIGMDGEFQQLLKVLGVPEGNIPTILDYYESHDAPSLTAKIRSIEAFQGLLAPMTQDGDGWRPDYSSRYFTEDFPYGLRFIHDLAHTHGIHAPLIDMVFDWGINKARQ